MDNDFGEITEGNIDFVLEYWMDVADTLKNVKKQEMELRKEIISFLDLESTAGTYTRGFTSVIAKAVVKYNHKFDEPLLETTYDSMSVEEQEAVRYKPSLSLAAYKLIAEANREKLDDCLIVTVAAPSLSVSWRTEDD